jgi:hypothetical protein
MAITRAQQAKQMLQDGGRIGLQGGGRDMGVGGQSPGPRGERGGSRTSPGPRGPRGEGPKTDAPSIEMINEIRRQNLEKAPDVKEQPNKFNFLDFVPGIGTARRIASVFGPLDNREFFRQKVVPAGRTNLNFDDYMKARRAGLIDAYGNPIDQDNDSNIILPQTMMAETMFQAPSNMDQELEDPEGLRLRFAAEGGPIGGIMDIESGRQMYFLGKLVKKATRAVKKIVKSPIGKAAILGGLAYFGGGGGMPKFLGGKGLGGFELSNLFSLTKNPLISTAGEFSPMKAIGLASLAPLAFSSKPEEEDEEEQDRGEGLDIARIRANPNLFLARRFVAEGGSMKEPVAKKTMPLLDMGGKEMDLREEGGFVPIGRMEKADDVPARLSKNEFVFTADAVRNAGDGNVDKGAEVMYNMMKNLESGGNVSEESQGLEGARKMFQTSQRLEEVL